MFVFVSKVFLERQVQPRLQQDLLIVRKARLYILGYGKQRHRVSGQCITQNLFPDYFLVACNHLFNCILHIGVGVRHSVCEPYLVLTVLKIVVERQRKISLNSFAVAVVRLYEFGVVIELYFVGG